MHCARLINLWSPAGDPKCNCPVVAVRLLAINLAVVIAVNLLFGFIAADVRFSLHEYAHPTRLGSDTSL